MTNLKQQIATALSADKKVPLMRKDGPLNVPKVRCADGAVVLNVVFSDGVALDMSEAELIDTIDHNLAATVTRRFNLHHAKALASGTTTTKARSRASIRTRASIISDLKHYAKTYPTLAVRTYVDDQLNGDFAL